MGPPTNACPLKSSYMFRPVRSISSQKLESLAASIACLVGLELPPVNFHAIASRYLTRLSLPVETILPHASRIYEWSMPPELWLSANESRLPTRAYVLALLIVSIRILYNIHGFGKWEMSLSKNKDGKNLKGMDIDVDEEKPDVNNVADLSDTSNNQYDNVDSAADPPNLDATDILLVLQSKYSELSDTNDHTKDLETYLEYCKDVVFAGAELSFEDQEEAQIIEDFWNYYQKKEDYYKLPEARSASPSRQLKRASDCAQFGRERTKKPKTDNAEITLDSKESHKERAIRQMISNMEENHFTYISPRTKVKRYDYLHYTRKKAKGVYAHAAHADYYILLRSCARVAQLDVRIMHAAVQAFERRLFWLEKNIQHSLTQMPYDESCKFCDVDDESTLNFPNDEYMDFSKLNL